MLLQPLLAWSNSFNGTRAGHLTPASGYLLELPKHSGCGDLCEKCSRNSVLLLSSTEFTLRGFFPSLNLIPHKILVQCLCGRGKDLSFGFAPLILLEMRPQWSIGFPREQIQINHFVIPYGSLCVVANPGRAQTCQVEWESLWKFPFHLLHYLRCLGGRSGGSWVFTSHLEKLSQRALSEAGTGWLCVRSLIPSIWEWGISSRLKAVTKAATAFTSHHNSLAHVHFCQWPTGQRLSVTVAASSRPTCSAASSTVWPGTRAPCVCAEELKMTRRRRRRAWDLSKTLKIC